ncbi:MAG: TolC family protein [Fuerstiella sp.]
MSGMEPSETRYGDRSSRKSHAAVIGVRQLLLVLLLSGCATSRTGESVQLHRDVERPLALAESPGVPIALASHQKEAQSVGGDSEVTVTDDSKPDTASSEAPVGIPMPASTLFAIESLPQLESYAVNKNPKLRRLTQQYEAARAKVGYVDGLPDPKLGANFFVSPIETAAGSQRANLTVSQMLPWLERLNAQKQQACFEAMAAQQMVAAERLRMIADLRELWFRLYVLDRQLAISEANQLLIKDLIEVANARVATGKAAQGDVLAGTLEYSRIEEQLVSLRQQRESTVAQLNRVTGRAADIAVSVPETLIVTLPDWDHNHLRRMSAQYQPMIQSARIETQATRWGIEVARLQRRPDFSVSASWFEIDSNRPQSSVVEVGQDAWSLGASVSIPLWDRKYDAIEDEARWKHAAAHAGVDELQQQFDSRILDLWQQAVAANETAELYRDTIIPQAKDTLTADQQSYATGTVEFDRIIKDVRNLLTLQAGYHRAVGQLATALARLEQAVGTRPS